MQGALHEAADGHGRRRHATQIDGGESPLSNSRERTVTITTQSYQAYSQVAQPEPFTVDNAPLNVANSGDCWKDYNPNGSRDLDRGAGGVGNADDVVLYTVTMVVPKMFPIDRFLGWAHTDTITQTTVLTNQPYAGRVLSVPTACMA
jgi:hypothetical protein